MQRCRREGVPKGELGRDRLGHRIDAGAPMTIESPFHIAAVARLFLALEQITVITFDDRVRLLVHVYVHPE
jgi:hypothetical protein